MHSGDCHRRADRRLRARIQTEIAAMRSMAKTARASTKTAAEPASVLRRPNTENTDGSTSSRRTICGELIAYYGTGESSSPILRTRTSSPVSACAMRQSLRPSLRRQRGRRKTRVDEQRVDERLGRWGWERRNEGEGLGSKATNEGMSRSASTPYETASPRRTPECAE